MRGRTAIIGLVVALITAFHLWQACHIWTWAIDEPLFFMRSTAAPWDASTTEKRFWAVDVMAVQRWAYYPALRLTGLDVVPADEKPCWVETPRGIAWAGRPDGRLMVISPSDTPDGWRTTLAEWNVRHGFYGPRRAILLMRVINLLTFDVLLVALLIAAWMILRSAWAVIVAVPAAVSMWYCGPLSIITASGDVFMLAGLAMGLLAWLWLRQRRQDGTLIAAVAIGALFGLATAAKPNGVLGLAAYGASCVILYPRRLWLPVVAGAVAVGVFLLANPVSLSGPIDFCRAVMARRAEVNAHWHEINGFPAWQTLMTSAFFWLPLAPVVGYLAWISRREWWIMPLVMWSMVIAVGTAAGYLSMANPKPSYLAPMHVAFWPCVVTLLIHTTRAQAWRGAPSAATMTPSTPIR